jgi:hypothetical protein
MIIFAWEPVKKLQKYAGVLFCLIARQKPLQRPETGLKRILLFSRFQGIGNYRV